ncbi:hypothetical protein D0T50_07870 [Bacteroides sp. 214]|uniref:glycosyl hydrolase family 28-related protein n=1 Tax=Bacteroides sp. 214 TaxID=2302935 RepID=UPI0013D6392E|nr:glycosyl hydrolase family 28-related protein [Bacteroides sp. 214]NDW12806.1 hypothetical protein [Bacteroides sp. 214]
MTFPAGVTLYFIGGMLTATAARTLTGNRTRIIAPIEQIFSDNITVNGSWVIDRAYPQWFGAKAYAVISDSAIDSTPAINKAIVMKKRGEVFVPRGVYRVNGTIEIKAGIALVGEIGEYNDDESEQENLGTILLPGASSLSSYTDGYLVRMNMLGDTWEIPYNKPGTLMKDLVFQNTWKKIGNLKGVCTAGSFEMNCCSWWYFKQVVFNIFVYSDQRKIVKCSYNGPCSNDTGDALYAFDFNTLGDALIFEGNAIHSVDPKVKGLRVTLSNGGSISSNIINNDVLIEASKGITFASNHLEGGVQVEIRDSNVTMMNNFLWKGTRPSLVIKSLSNGQTPVVKSSGDLFLYYGKELNDSTDYDISNINEYDVQIDNNCSLEFSQTYRYWVLSGLIGAMYIYGINICTNDNEITQPFSIFNEQSYLLSSSCRIMPGYTVMKMASMDNMLEPNAYGYGSSSYAKWYLNSGTYHYKYQILWDKTRLIAGQSDILTWYTTGGSSINMTKNGEGLLFHLSNARPCGNQAMLRLYRGTSTDYTHYIDIPVAGAIHLYENGISVSGFKWKELTPSENILNANTNITSIFYKGKNVECKAPAQPLYGTWQEGDVVYNNNPNRLTSYWIYLGGAWRERL